MNVVQESILDGAYTFVNQLLDLLSDAKELLKELVKLSSNIN